MPMPRVLAADAARHRAQLSYLQPELSWNCVRNGRLYGGSFGGGMISTAWKPHPRNAFAEGGRAMLGQAGIRLVAEFLHRIRRRYQSQDRREEAEVRISTDLATCRVRLQRVAALTAASIRTQVARQASAFGKS